MRQKIHPRFLKLLSFYETPPVEALTQLDTKKLKEKLLIRNSLVELEVEPTETNYWIWYGAYSEGHPKIGSVQIKRTLFMNFFRELKIHNKRVKSKSDFKFDVNPYKLYISFPHKIEDNSSAIFARQNNLEMYNVVLERCKDQILNSYIENVFDAKEDFVQTLVLGNQFPRVIVEHALEELEDFINLK